MLLIFSSMMVRSLYAANTTLILGKEDGVLISSGLPVKANCHNGYHK
jgi:hypothetical protein